MTTIAEVRTELAEAVALAGLNASAYPTDAIVAPCAHVFRGEMTPRLVLGATKQAYAFTVRLYTKRTLEIAAQQALDEFCAMTGATSIRAAIQNGANWTVDVDYAEVVSIGATEVVDVGGEQFLTVDFSVEVVW